MSKSTNFLKTEHFAGTKINYLSVLKKFSTRLQNGDNNLNILQFENIDTIPLDRLKVNYILVRFLVKVYISTYPLPIYPS